MSLDVAVLGTGAMGLPMARNMLRAGLAVSAWNRSAERAEPLAAEGATIAATPADAVQSADVIVTMLTDADATATVTRDALPAMRDDAVWAQMGTVGIAGTELCSSLAEKRGVAFVDAPVSGTKEPAEQGTLIVLPSGPASAVERCLPVFDAVGSKTVRLGDAGEGTRMKLVLNNWLVGLLESEAETIALAEGLNLDPKLFLETISGGSVDSPYAQLKGRMMIEGQFPPSFALRLAAKDADLVIDAASRHGLDLPLIRTVAAQMHRAEELGHGDDDVAATFAASEPRAPGAS
jgi:3-hydroxyisobutyrate dehydrogenase